MPFWTTSPSSSFLMYRIRLLSLENEDFQSRRAEDLEKESRSDWRKRLLDSSFGKVGKVNYSSLNVLSSAEDLSTILLDDHNDSWDLLENMGEKRKKKCMAEQKNN